MRRARNVLLLHSSASGYGADRQLVTLATGLDPARYRPIVVLPEDGRIGPILRRAGVEVRHTELATLRRGLLRGHDLIHTLRLWRRNRIELGAIVGGSGASLVHTNTSIVLGGEAGARAADVPHVLHVREIYPRSSMAAATLWPALRRRILRADAVLAVSRPAAKQLGPAANVRVIHDGLKASGTEGGSKDARRSLGLPLDRFVIGMVGRISDWKGQHILANALALEPLASIAAVGVVAGEAAPGQEHFGHELELLRTRLGLGERLRLLGYRDDVELVYAAVDAFAAPSTHSDSLPNAVIEAALAGLPVVGAADGGGTPEIIRDGVTGVIIPSGDPGRLASALRELATDAHGARRFGRRAAEEVGSRFRPERMLERVQAVYDEVLE